LVISNWRRNWKTRRLAVVHALSATGVVVVKHIRVELADRGLVVHLLVDLVRVVQVVVAATAALLLAAISSKNAKWRLLGERLWSRELCVKAGGSVKPPGRRGNGTSLPTIM
jgi:hypothetical protein